jgi:hypothetical protein
MALKLSRATTSPNAGEREKMTEGKEWLRPFCEYPYAPSLVGEAILDWAGREETAREKARRIWKMEKGSSDETQQ